MTTAAASPEHDQESGSEFSGRLIFAIAVAFSSFQIWTAAFSPLPSLIVRSIHVGFLLLLLFAIGARRKSDKPVQAALDWAVGLLVFALAFYQWIFETELIQRAGDPNTMDLVVGTLVVVLVFEGARRMMGSALPIICGLFLAYALFGEYLTAPLDHRGYDWYRTRRGPQPA